MCFSKAGDFHEVKRAFELKGHSAGVYCFCFNNDSTRMASVSKDGTWKYWDTNGMSNLTLLHSEWPKLYGVLAVLSAIGFK